MAKHVDLNMCTLPPLTTVGMSVCGYKDANPTLNWPMLHADRDCFRAIQPTACEVLLGMPFASVTFVDGHEDRAPFICIVTSDSSRHQGHQGCLNQTSALTLLMMESLLLHRIAILHIAVTDSTSITRASRWNEHEGRRQYCIAGS